MATLHPNHDEYYESEEDEVEFSRLEAYIDGSRADHEEEPEAPGAAEEAEVEEAALGTGEIESEDNAGGGEGGAQVSNQRYRRSRERQLPVLPPVPQFHPLVHDSAMHARQTCYPLGFDPVNCGALGFFQLFFDDIVFEQLAETTNSYAIFKGASNPGHRRWTPTSAAELKIFFGIIIYMGVFPSAQVPDYWRHDSDYPYHRIGLYLSQTHFEQLKRYFHISPPYESLPRSQWYQKFQPLSSTLARRFQYFLLPASKVAVDEMMIRFTGRSAHTIQIRGKPIPKGYKVLALCDHGYTYSFLFTSNTESFAELNSDLYTGPLRLSPTSKAIYQLASCLPSDHFSFTIYMDNYFTNIPLLTALREKKIGACGTARSTSAEYPAAFKFRKNQKPTFPLNTISGLVCREVLVCIWQDNNLVQFMSTVHQITNEPSNYPMKVRRRPRVTNANRANVTAFFGDRALVSMPTPKLAIDYNNKMNSVDIADQFRSYYSTQLRVSRVWMPVFFWLLDTTVINAWTLAKCTLPESKKQNTIHNHRNFRIQLAHSLAAAGYRAQNPTRAAQLAELIASPPTTRSNGRHCPGVTPTGNNYLSRRYGLFHFTLPLTK